MAAKHESDSSYYRRYLTARNGTDSGHQKLTYWEDWSTKLTPTTRSGGLVVEPGTHRSKAVDPIMVNTACREKTSQFRPWFAKRLTDNGCRRLPTMVGQQHRGGSHGNSRQKGSSPAPV
ncbi:hypothetical protein L6452_19765 [Arctium lappa]|uniref:Uncharacterized protein n=1 Tax=Arctium lappa TaxID=4217 RepID=A0ACB9B9J7_ARCLA|nr:hypothetical protein L6452_19765 [Arctium lappa]